MNIFEHLQKEVEQLNKEIKAVQNIILFARNEYAKVKASIGNFRTGAVISDTERHLAYMMEQKIEKEKKLLLYKRINREKKIRIMHFKASHHNFRPGELEEMMNKIQEFKKVPYICKGIDGGMSDEVALYTEEEVSREEAQMIMDTIIETDFDDEPALFCYQGKMFVWDGNKIERE